MEHLHPIIRERYSTVTFSSKQVEDEKLSALFEAARWAPSSYNEQPWMFLVGIKGKDENYQKIFDCLMEANQSWAKYAPVLAISLSRKISEVSNKPNRFAQYDTGMAVGNLLAQATAMELYVHQMGGFSVNKAREFFNIDEQYEVMAAMAIGYKGDVKIFPEDLQERELKKRVRKPLNDLFL